MSGESLSKKQKMRMAYLSEEKRNKEIYAMLPYYEDVVILGDSIAESILDYRLLRKKNVIAKRGRCVDMIAEDIIKAIRLAPKAILLEYGKNDVLHFQKDYYRFIKIYQTNLRFLKEHLPDTTLYVNSLIPIGSRQLEKMGGREVFDKFNQALEAMCLSEDVVFINNTSLIDWEDELFEFDGIHPKYPFYPRWLRHMAETAGLMETDTVVQV